MSELLVLIKSCSFDIHEGVASAVVEFHLEDISMDWDPEPPSRFNYLIEYFRKMKRTNGSLKYFTLSVHNEKSNRKTVFNFQLQKQLIQSLYSALPNVALVFSCALESQSGNYYATQKGSLDLRELITAETWKDNCDFHTVTRSTSPPLPPSKGRFDLSVGWKAPAKIRNIQISTQYFMEKLFRDDATKDLTIVAGNGFEIKCHSIIFSAHSPVFSRILSSQNAIKEAISGRFEMSENSEDGVRTLIKYLYGMPLIIEDLSADVAVELFQTAHKYDLSQLEGALLRLFMKMDVDWFTPDAILELYLFVKQLDCLNYLLAHCLLLMTSMDIRDFRACEEFKKLDALQSTDVLVEMVDSLKKRVPKTDQRGVKRKGEED